MDAVFAASGVLRRRIETPENDLAQAFIRGELLWWHRGKDNLKRQGEPKGGPP